MNYKHFVIIFYLCLCAATCVGCDDEVDERKEEKETRSEVSKYVCVSKCEKNVLCMCVGQKRNVILSHCY